MKSFPNNAKALRATLFLASSAAAIAIASPAYADATAPCNANAGPDGIAGNADDVPESTECGVNATASGAGATADRKSVV